MTGGCCCCRGALLTQVQLVFHENPKAFTAGLHSTVNPQSALIRGVVLSQVFFTELEQIYESEQIYHVIENGQALSTLVLRVMLIQAEISSGPGEHHFNLRKSRFSAESSDVSHRLKERGC